MNKEYLQVNDNVVVNDDNGIQSPREYTDNIEEILITENIIEDINIKLPIKQQNLEVKQNIVKNYKKGIFSTLILFVGVPLIGTPIISNILYLGGTPIIEQGIIAGQSLTTAFTVFFTTYLGVLIGLPSVLAILGSRKSTLKQINGIQNEVNFLTRQLERQKEKLKQLENEKTKEKQLVNDSSLTSSVKQVDDKEVLEKYRQTLALYYDVGAKEKNILNCIKKVF